MATATAPSTSETADLYATDLADEYQPWRALVEAALLEAENRTWDAVVPSRGALGQRAGAPLLAGVQVNVPRGLLPRVGRRCLDAAQRNGAGLTGALAPLLDDEVSARLFVASLDGDYATVEMIAARSGLDVEATESVAFLLPIPFLQACHRTLAGNLDESWAHGYCPLCGSWPAFAELRGMERGRRLRCGRCGSDWYSQLLSCGFCGTTDHKDFITLVPSDELQRQAAGNEGQPERAGGLSVTGAVEVCIRCSHYVKRFSSLRGWPPTSVLRQDLESAALDFSAMQEGYVRPRGTGQALHLRLAVS